MKLNPRYVASDLGLLCLLKPYCSNNLGKYDRTLDRKK